MAGVPIVLGWAGGASMPANQAPTAITFAGGLSHADNAPVDTIVGHGVITDADSATMNSIVCSNSKYKIVNISGKDFDVAVALAGVGNFTPGTESSTFTATDSSGNPLTSGSQTITVNDHTAQILLATMELVNDTSNSVSAGRHSKLFGMSFVAGDIPSGTYPDFQVGGSSLAYSMSVADECRYHADGSLDYAVFMLRLPSFTASQTKAMEVWSGGAGPGSNSRALSDLPDIAARAVGVDELTGTWDSDVQQGITDNDRVTLLMDGAAGKHWSIGQAFRQSSADHGQLDMVHYAFALEASGGALAETRWGAIGRQPYYNVNSPAKTAREFTLDLVVNGSTRRSISGAPFQMTYSGSANIMTATSHGRQRGSSGRASNSGGALPAGLPSGERLWLNTNRDEVFSNNLRFADNSPAALSFSTAGTGTHTFTPTITCLHFGGFATLTDAGDYDCFNASDASIDPCPVRVVHDFVYLRSTKKILPFVTNATPVYNDGYAAYYRYNPGSNWPFYPDVGGTGERDDIAPIPEWHVFQLMNPTRNTEQTSRVIGLQQLGMPMTVMKSGTFMPPCVNHGAYSGLENIDDFFWRGRTSGDEPKLGVGSDEPINSAGGDLSGMWFGGQEMDHMGDFAYVPYLLFGDWFYRDLVVDMALNAVHANGSFYRDLVAGGVTYHTFIGGQIRSNGWGGRSIAEGIRALHEDSPIRAYLIDLMNDTIDYTLAHMGDKSSFLQDNGFFVPEPNQGGALYPVFNMTHVVYVNRGFAHAKNLLYPLGVTKTLDMINYLAKFPAGLYNHFGFADVFTGVMGNWKIGSTPAPITSWDDFHWGATQFGDFSWDGSTDVMTMFNWNINVADGDKIMFGDFWATPTNPGGVSDQTSYFLRDVTNGIPAGNENTTWKIAATDGGAAINLTNSGVNTDGKIWGLQLWTQPPDGRGYGYDDYQSYSIGARASVRELLAAGASTTGLAAVNTASRVSTQYNPDLHPKSAVEASY